MITHMEYEVICSKVDRLAEEIKELQHAVRQMKPSTEEKSEAVWENLMKLAEEVSAKWQGSNAVEEIRAQRNKGLKV